MTATKPELAARQRWSRLDRRYDGWRYFTITALNDRHVYAITRSGKGTRIRRNRFGTGRGWSYCGHDGPGPLPAYTTERSVILGCYPYGRKHTVLPLETELEQGFGGVTFTRDGQRVWSAYSTRKRLAHIELLARDIPGDWRLEIHGAMSGQLYQRQDDGWVLVAIDHGFA
ncbi:hypothetical protein [Catellatospora methionotrophica]|nr:hypothetical protein [Catellatospora methionotrophica]